MHGEATVPGRIYVAPPDNHLMLRPGYLHVVRGPKENGHRPAVDALFRTAATVYGPRVIGVVLTGYLDCGTAGMLSIKARGGLAVVQDPRDASVSDMPQSVVEHVEVDHIAPLRDIPGLLSRLASEPAGAAPAHLPGALMELEGDEPGVAAEIVCPSCQGKLTESALNGFQVFRCHVGHAFSLESVAAEQADEIERALWAAVRALEEGAALSRRLAAGASGHLRQRFEEKEAAQAQQAHVIRNFPPGRSHAVPKRRGGPGSRAAGAARKLTLRCAAAGHTNRSSRRRPGGRATAACPIAAGSLARAGATLRCSTAHRGENS
jgi:two-component system chemotaxis response regulator CheB